MEWRLESWLAENLGEVLSDLNAGCSDAELDQLEKRIGRHLPDEMRAFYKRHDGQADKVTGLFLGLCFLSCKQVLEHWKTWSELLKTDRDHGELRQ